VKGRTTACSIATHTSRTTVTSTKLVTWGREGEEREEKEAKEGKKKGREGKKKEKGKEGV
jgi:hypothetical protein